MGQIQFIVSLMMVTLFIGALIGFGINIAEDNNSAMSLSDDTMLMDFNSTIKGNISSMKDTTEESYTSIVGSSVDQTDTIKSGGVIALTITNIVPVVNNILTLGYKKIFGSGNEFGIFLTGLITIIVFLGFMFFIKTWLGRNPD